MINLIPTEEKKKMQSDFWIRLVTVGLVVFGGVILIASVALLPSYFHVMVKNSLANQKIETQKNTPIPQVEAEIISKVDALNKKLELIEKSNTNKFLISDRVLNHVIQRKITGIKITEISYDNNPARGREIRVSGEATSREQLLLFKLALESDPLFSKVDLPVSNFVRGSNIIFFLTLVPAQ